MRPERASDIERYWWVATLFAGLLSAWPFFAYGYLPMVDLPMHQLEFAIWCNGEAPGAWTQYYDQASLWHPYWFSYWVGRPFVAVLGVAAASKTALVLHALLLPTAAGALARASGRSGWLGLMLAPFVYEFNLSYGFVAYCFAWTLALFGLAIVLRLEHAKQRVAMLLLLGGLSLCIGWSHPQVAAMYVALAAGLELLNNETPILKRARILALTCLAIIPLIVWSLQPRTARRNFGANPIFASFGTAFKSLPEFSIDTLPDRLEEAMMVIALLALILAWRRPRFSQHLRDLRLPIAASLAVLAYFIMPFEWGGQAISQRMPFLALLLLPALFPARMVVSSGAATALLALAVLGTTHTHLALRGFHSEASGQIDPLMPSVEDQAKVLYVAYDNSSLWVNAPVYVHAGAWFALHARGPYAFHFNRLVNHYSDEVPADQNIIGKEWGFARTLKREGRFAGIDPNQKHFWDTFIVRWPKEIGQPIMPFSSMDGIRVVAFDRTEQWGVIRLQR